MFADISDVIASNPPALHYGVAAADVDGDGRPEFVVAGFGGPNRVLKWAAGQLRDVAPRELADPDNRAVGVAAGDLDGDGAEELYVLNADNFREPVEAAAEVLSAGELYALNADPYSAPKQSADRLFKRLPDSRWEDLFSRPENHAVRNLAAGRSVAVIDRRGVGRYGFVVANYGRPMRLYELGPTGALADLAPPLDLNPMVGGRGLLTAPLFGDHTDVVCVTEHGPNLVFRNRGDGTFENVAARLGLADPEEHGRGVAAVDADGDGRLDLCWGNWDGPHRLMVRRPDGTWKDRATPGLAFPSAVRTVIAADFDNDGRDELFFNNLGEPNRLFRILAPSGGCQPPESAEPDIAMLDPGDALEPDGLGTGAAVADIDNDGVLELLVAHGESRPQPLSLFKARSTAGNDWLRVVPLTRFGAPARGALVQAACPDRVRVKVVCGGSGYLCQMEPAAHFGLGRGTPADHVVVTWPDGATASLAHPSPNRTHTVPYPRG